jgi:hypothetical protein
MNWSPGVLGERAPAPNDCHGSNICGVLALTRMQRIAFIALMFALAVMIGRWADGDLHTADRNHREQTVGQAH